MTSARLTAPAVASLDHIFPFDHDHGTPARELAGLLGGKGAGLAEMTTALGVDVPPGFTVSLPLCRAYRADGWPADLDAALRRHVDRLGDVLGRRFGDAADPLLVAVRSGSPISMPGMLDTVLDLGLNDETVVGLARVSGDERFAWDSYRRFVLMFGCTVRGVDPAELPTAPADADAAALRAHVAELRAAVETRSGSPVPADPYAQLHEAVEAVFRSWDSARAVAYRDREGIDPELGTAVNVQAMVFGNREGVSGTGVAFTRDPQTGAPGPYGDYLPHAQGEDIVSGSAHTLPIRDIETIDAALYAQLRETIRRIEVHYRDLCDIEFTVESGRLWMLQTRVGKRGAVAAVRVAVDLVDDPDIALTRAEALERVPAELRDRARTELDAQRGDLDDAPPVGHGLGASAGRATGRAVFSAAAAVAATEPVIMVRPETSPEDVMGMSASVGILTTKGGLVSHAAVVARGWGVPAVVGAVDFALRDDELRCPDGTRIVAGDEITIDGTSGAVWCGCVEGTGGGAVLPQLVALEEWAAEADRATGGAS